MLFYCNSIFSSPRIFLYLYPSLFGSCTLLGFPPATVNVYGARSKMIFPGNRSLVDFNRTILVLIVELSV